jgi:hypothetical protein
MRGLTTTVTIQRVGLLDLNFHDRTDQPRDQRSLHRQGCSLEAMLIIPAAPRHLSISRLERLHALPSRGTPNGSATAGPFAQSFTVSPQHPVGPAPAARPSDRDCDNIPGTVSNIDHNRQSRARILAISPAPPLAPFGGCDPIRCTPISEDNGGCYDPKFCVNFPGVWRDFRSLLCCNLGILVCGTAAWSECSTRVNAMPEIDALLSQIARAKGFAAAMIDTAMRKRFESMVAEFQRELDAIEKRRVSQGDSGAAIAALAATQPQAAKK